MHRITHRMAATLGWVAVLMVVALVGGTAKADWFRDKVDENIAHFVEAFNAGDASAVAGLYAEDAKLMSPGSSVVEGRAAIEEFWGGVFGIGEVSLTLGTSEAHNNGTLGYSVGSYTLSIQPAEGEPMADEGKYIIVWKRGPTGRWELAVDIWNTNLSPSG
jgi:ketosteroid isomerase-like protein